MAQESKLKFVGSNVADDSTHQSTVVTNALEVTQAEYDALIQAGEVLPDVDYYIEDAAPTAIDAAHLPYDSNISTKEKIESLTAEDIEYSSTQNVKEKIDSLSASDISYGASTIKNTLDNLVLNELEIFEFATSDGRYFTLTFSSIAWTRFPIQIWACRQASAASVQMGSVSNANNNNQMYFTDSSITYDRSSKTITVDLGSNAWGAAYLLAKKGLLVKA